LIGFISCTPSVFVHQTLVDFQERHDPALLPEIVRGRNAINLAIHGALEQDRADHLFAGESRRLDDTGAHGVDLCEHLLVIGIGVFRHAVEFQRLGRGAARLVKRGDEAVLLRHLLRHGCIHHAIVPRSVAS
jgi:hypothetical protein